MTTTRKPRAPRKTKTAEAVDATVKTETVHTEEAKSFSWTDYIDMLNEKFGNGPSPAISWKRELCAWVLGLATAFSIGWLMAAAIEAVMMVIMATTGSATLSILTWITGIILAMYVGNKASSVVFYAVRNKTIDQAYETVKSTVSGWFNSNEVTA